MNTHTSRKRARGGGQWNCADSCSRVSFTVMLAYFSHVFAIFHNSLVFPFMCFSMCVCVCACCMSRITFRFMVSTFIHEYYEK